VFCASHTPAVVWRHHQGHHAKEKCMHRYLDVLKKYAVFHGRARRKEYWYFGLVNPIITMALAVIDGITGSFIAEADIGLLSGLYTLGVLLPGIVVSVRRLHDTNRTGWWLLIYLIPVIGALVFLVFVVQDGKPGENRYGPNPKAAIA
jgi:uncharacterized membrane protein YhaH (DUF805 family)